MGKSYPLHARVAPPRAGKRKRGKRKRASPASFVGQSPKPDIGKRSVAARLSDLEKLRSLRSRVSHSSAQSRPPKVSEPSHAVLDIQALKRRLRDTPAGLIVKIWRNAIGLMTEESGARRNVGAQAVTAIEKEWRRRRLAPISPEDFFKWPSTDAPGGDGSLSFADTQPEGMLSYLEYRVGKVNGQPPSVRKVILDRVFLGELPPVFPRGYFEQWRTPSTAGRLQKMAESLAAFCRNAKRRDDDRLVDAIRDWEADLRYLYDTYYVAKFHFAWPDSRI